MSVEREGRRARGVGNIYYRIRYWACYGRPRSPSGPFRVSSGPSSTPPVPRTPRSPLRSRVSAPRARASPERPVRRAPPACCRALFSHGHAALATYQEQALHSRAVSRYTSRVGSYVRVGVWCPEDARIAEPPLPTDGSAPHKGRTTLYDYTKLTGTTTNIIHAKRTHGATASA